MTPDGFRHSAMDYPSTVPMLMPGLGEQLASILRAFDWCCPLFAFVSPERWKWIGIPGILKNGVPSVAVQTNIVNG